MFQQIKDSLESAKESRDVERLKQLIVTNLKILRSTDSSGNNLLHYAASYGNKEFTQFLLNSGVQINAVNNLGQTALHSAVTNNQDQIVYILIEKVTVNLILILLPCRV
jgi:ankyrin repeat protein